MFMKVLCSLLICLFVAASAYSQSAILHFIKGNTAFKEKKYQEAETQFSECIRLDPRHTGCYLNRGLTRELAIGYGLALEDFNKLVELLPADAKPYRLRGSLLISMKRYQQGIADIDKSLSIDRTNAYAYYRRGYAHKEMGNNEKAIEDHTLSISYDPNDAHTFSSRGRLYEATGKPALAIADYTKAVTLKPNDAFSLYSRGSIYFKDGKTELAEADFTRALAIDKSYSAQINALKILARVNAMKPAGTTNTPTTATVKPTPSPAAVIKPATPTAGTLTSAQLVEKGRSFAAAKNYSAAVEQYTLALGVDPNNGLAFFYRGVANDALNKLEAAISDHTSAIRIGTSVKEAYSNRAVCYIRQMNYNAAVADLNTSISLAGGTGTWSSHYNRGLSYFGLNDMTKALWDVSKAIELNPKWADAFTLRAKIYCKQDLTLSAIKDQEAAIALGKAVTKGCTQ